MSYKHSTRSCQLSREEEEEEEEKEEEEEEELQQQLHLTWIIRIPTGVLQ